MNRTSSLGEFLEQYSRYHPEDVFGVNRDIDVEYESTAYYKLLEEKNPLIWFSNVKGHPGFPTGDERNGIKKKDGVCARLGLRV